MAIAFDLGARAADLADQRLVHDVADAEQHRPGEQRGDVRADRRSERGLHAQRDEEVIGGIHAEHHEVALGEVDHAHDAEDQRQGHAHQAVDRPDLQSRDSGLEEVLHHLRGHGALLPAWLWARRGLTAAPPLEARAQSGHTACIGLVLQAVDARLDLGGAPGAQHGRGGSAETGPDFDAGGRHHVIQALHDQRAVGQADPHLGALCGGEALGEGLVLLQARERDQAQNSGVAEVVIVVLGDGPAPERRGDPELDAHLGLQGALEGPHGIASRIADGGSRQAHEHGAHVVEIGAKAARDPHCRLAGSLGKIAGRNWLVIDAEDFWPPVGEQGD